MITRYYDETQKRLVYIAQAATSEFWDSHWSDRLHETYLTPPPHRSTVWFTQRYLPVGSTILEGGCGMGDKVYALDKAGFNAKGVDYAPDTVALTKQYWPHLDVLLGDVRKLPFQSCSFDGYWSLGVIEHFFNGFSDIASEIERVLKPGGYLFLTFPMMNTLRHKRAKRREFPLLEECDRERLMSNFYQFALDPNEVIKEFRSLGFAVEYRGGLSSFDCLAEETRWFKWLDRVLHYLPFGLRTKLCVVADAVCGSFFGHVALLVLRKT
jgi:SAM-dependent methyltransferase